MVETGTPTMKAWIDKNNVITLRDDVELPEAQELYEMLAQAFDAGLKQGLREALRISA